MLRPEITIVLLSDMLAIPTPAEEVSIEALKYLRFYSSMPKGENGGLSLKRHNNEVPM